MKKLYLFILPLLLILAPLSADVITVDNNPGSVAMFTDVGGAIAAAESGDILLIAGSPTSYGTHNIYKELHFVGVGYFLSENGIPGLNTARTIVHTTFKQDNTIGDSSNSSATGISGAILSDPSVSGIVIDKCYTPSWSWRFQGQVTITGCFSLQQIRLDASSSSVSNTIVTDLWLFSANTTATNCVVTTRVRTDPASSISNTIFTFTNGANFDSDGSYSFCMTIGTSFLEEGSGNINNQFAADVFSLIGSSGKDAYYQLTDVSTAMGVGFGGDDMGAYGGSDPYVLSGVPGHPRLTRLTVPSTATGLTALTFEVEAEAFAE